MEMETHILPAENGLTGSIQKRDDDSDRGGSVPIGRQVKNCCRDTWTLDNILAKFPVVKWLPKYRCDAFQSDLIAGLTVGLTVIPQGLAYAQIAGLPPQYGLYSAFMGCFVYILMGTSKDITLGPTAIMSLMTATFASMDGDPTLAIFLSLVCGVVQFAMGVLKLGILVNFISYPVINAFTSAAAITIALGQVKNVLGLKDIEREFLHMVYDTCRKIPETNIWDMIMGLISLVAVMLLKKLRQIKYSDEDDPDSSPSIPIIIARKIIWLVGTGANAIIVIVGAGVVAILESQDLDGYITVTGNIKAGLPDFSVPKFSATVPSTNETLAIGDIFTKIGAGLGIVPLLGLVETMAIGKAFARANSYKIDPTQELLAIGVANFLSSFVSSYPITGSFSRTAVNSQSGVRTPMGGLWTGGLVILALAFLTPMFYYIPKAALAAVIIAAVIQMVDYEIVVTLWRANKWDLVPLFLTFITSFVIGIEYGILIGIGVSVLMLLYPTARPKIKYTAGSGYLIVTPMQGLNFPGAEHLELVAMEKALSGEKPRSIIVNMEHLSDMDFTAVQSIKTLMVDCGKNGMQFIVCNGQPEIHRKLEAGKIKDLKLYPTLKDAVEEFGVHGHEDSTTIVVEEEEPFMSRL